MLARDVVGGLLTTESETGSSQVRSRASSLLVLVRQMSGAKAMATIPGQGT